MSKFLTIISFCSLILIQPISWFGWEIWYQLEREYVSNVLCENKEEPELECNGKCYLAKQLKAASNETSQEDEKIPVPRTQQIECVVSNTSKYELIFMEELSENEMYSNPANTLLHGYCTPIEHPPC